MRKCNLRSGSALLIVLGMLTFLIVSAVGFSAYMRQGRLPSSQLRRTVAARHLVKAAMAEAIDTIDQAINDNPHPNIGTKSVDGYNRNVWCNRIFIGTNDWNESSFDFANTVSPLCLEALAYIPPTLINEARYYSRLSPAAEWKSFDYGVGRYAFCAIDVSDYFDVNRLFANKRRSSAPHERVSLSYLFEKGKDHNSASGSDAEAWDKFMEGFRKVDNDTGSVTYDGSSCPLISLADFNLAFHKYGGVGKMKSPFCEYLESKTGEIVSMGEDGAAGSDAKLSCMTFVTDSLFPNAKSNDSSTKVLDLSDSANQPFDLASLSKSSPAPDTFSKVFWSNSELARYLGNIGNVCLFDYLDVDRKPLSLALPTVERIPMICGVQPLMQNFELAIKKVSEPAGEGLNIDREPDKDNPTRLVSKTFIYKIDYASFAKGLQSGIRALTVYPFARSTSEDIDGVDFKLDGRLSFFFTSGDVPLRTSDNINEKDIFRTKIETDVTSIDNVNGVIHITGVSNRPIELPKDIKDEDISDRGEFFKTFVQEPHKLTLAFEESLETLLDDSNNALLKVVYKWEQSRNQNGEWEPSLEEVVAKRESDKIEEVKTAFPWYICDEEGGWSLDRDITDGEVVEKDRFKELILGSGKRVRLNCAVWLKIKDSDDYVVDMVPACHQDDNTYNKVSLDQTLLKYGSSHGCDPASPLLRFDTNIEFDFALNTFDSNDGNKSSSSVSLGTSKFESAIVADPRYNYAPEEWFLIGENSGLTKETWLEKNIVCQKSSHTENSRYDFDMFMETSDAGYLQSIYELAFLPRTKELVNNGSTKPELSGAYSTSKEYTNLAASFAQTRYRELAWCTYNPIDLDREAFNEIANRFTSLDNGFKINPYSDSKNVVMAAFANSPMGWRYSSTNWVEGNMAVNYSKLKMEDYNARYAFNQYNEKARVKWNDLEKVAETFRCQVTNYIAKGESWQKAFLGEIWDGEWKDQPKGENQSEERFVPWDYPSEDNFFGESMGGARFWGVDKKFLYGFWKDCFAVKQQLFLVFVRAEPTMMGSGATGHAPPQLGGKAVALVWRDPNPLPDTSGGSGSGTDRAIPHKTRVLFYRQFE